MKKCLRKLSLMLCMSLILSMVLGMTALADGTDTSVFDFGQTVMTIRQGESQTITLRASKAYTYYMVGNTSRATYCECSGNAGKAEITFHVGSDETAGKSIMFWFYVEGSDQHDNVEVKVQSGTASSVKTANTTAVAAANAAVISPTVIPATTQTTIAFPDGTSGVVAVSGNSVGLVSDGAGAPLGAFAVANARGTLQPITLQNVVSVNRISFIGISSEIGAKSAVIMISAADKTALMTRGIAGLCINGQYVLWP